MFLLTRNKDSIWERENLAQKEKEKIILQIIFVTKRINLHFI